MAIRGASFLTELMLEILHNAKATDTELTIYNFRRHVIRYAGNRLIQNLVQDDSRIYLKAVDRGRVGVSSTNQLTRDGINQALIDAVTIANLQTDISSYQLPAGVQNYNVDGLSGLVDYQAEAWLQPLFQELAEEMAQGAGSVTVDTQEIAVGNTRGILSYQSGRQMSMNCIATRGNFSGYAGRWSPELTAVDFMEVGREAINRTNWSNQVSRVEPGEYQVVLSPYATADFVWLLQYMGFSARDLLEEKSFLLGRMQTKIAADTVNLREEPRDSRGFVSYFDWEGVPRQSLDLIRDGVATGVVYDSWTGTQMNHGSTGHAIPAVHFGKGPYPINLVLETGRASEAELIAKVERGIYINRFHYTNVVDPREALATGMTRDANYFIEGGKIKGKIANLRFSDSLLRALAQGVTVGNNAQFVFDGDTGFVVPSLQLDSLKFSS